MGHASARLALCHSLLSGAGIDLQSNSVVCKTYLEPIRNSLQKPIEGRSVWLILTSNRLLLSIRGGEVSESNRICVNLPLYKGAIEKKSQQSSLYTNASTKPSYLPITRTFSTITQGATNCPICRSLLPITVMFLRSSKMFPANIIPLDA